MSKIWNLSQYTNVLPYASELFGVYQPLLGWKSRRILRRFERGMAIDKRVIDRLLYQRINGQVEFGDRTLEVKRIEIGQVQAASRANQSFLIDELATSLPPESELSEAALGEIINEKNLSRVLQRVVEQKFKAAYSPENLRAGRAAPKDFRKSVAEQAYKESVVARYLLELQQQKDVNGLKKVFYGKATDFLGRFKMFEIPNPLDVIDPHKDLDRIIVSPLSIVHIFRQYFFEFDTFLGTPVEHVWLSPGSSVELIETSSRKTTVEKTFESEFETITKAEKELTELDEISDSVKSENQSNTKFGFNTQVEQGWVGGSAEASSSINLDNTQQKSRETAHRQMRQQTQRLSTEIRKNYKSSFKTITETTDFSSKRFLLNNTTDQLINYELRRKMRQVGVQVQDVGTYLCWQTYVDDPGRQLGVAKLVHLAKPADLDSIPPPDSIAYPEKVVTEKAIDIPFIPRTEDTNSDDMDETYRHGKEVDTDVNEGAVERVEDDFRDITILCDQPGYTLENISIDHQGNDMEAEVRNLSIDPTTPGRATFDVHLNHVNFRNTSPLRIVAKASWMPTDERLGEIDAENSKLTQEHNAKKQREFRQAYMKAARERIKLASEVESRKFEELRDEERIVVYRALIQDMLTKDLPLDDNRTRHAVAELLNSIFDIDKMLYFVAPEWWRPRLHRSRQNLGGFESSDSSAPSSGSSGNMYSVFKEAKAALKFQLKPKPQVPETNTVGWGGIHELGRDNYYITEESEPARLGSSLGWLLQLDGDNLRNAFLNAPWVKAVIPIRPGKERAAFNWLQRLNVEGSDGLDSEYIAPASELSTIDHNGPKVTLRDAINHLCNLVKDKHDQAQQTGLFPIDEINDDNKVTATPIDKVYEHGFYPNQGGFKLGVDDNFEVFDQWVEILPTDQIVPVEVKYDPITGRQLPPTE